MAVQVTAGIGIARHERCLGAHDEGADRLPDTFYYLEVDDELQSNLDNLPTDGTCLDRVAPVLPGREADDALPSLERLRVDEGQPLV